MKAKVLASLKTKYSNLGLSEKTLDGYAEKLAENIKEESEIENVVSGAEWMLKLAQAETDKVRGEKSQLQKQLEELSKKDPSEEEEEVDPDMPVWAKEVLKNQKAQKEENELLKETIQKLQNGETSKSRQAILEEAIKGTSEGFGKVVRSSFEHLKNSSEEDYNNWIEGIKANAKENIESQAAYNPRSGVKFNQTDVPSSSDVENAYKYLKGE